MAQVKELYFKCLLLFLPCISIFVMPYFIIQCLPVNLKYLCSFCFIELYLLQHIHNCFVFCLGSGIFKICSGLFNRKRICLLNYRKRNNTFLTDRIANYFPGQNISGDLPDIDNKPARRITLRNSRTFPGQS